jgi:hypothetical protein
LSGEKWFNAKDFDKGLAEARKHYPKPSRKAAPKAKPVLVAPPPPDQPVPAKDEPKASPKPNPPQASLKIRITGCRAKFLPIWRVRIR